MRPRSITLRLALFFCVASTAVLIGLGWLVGVLVEQHFVQQDVAELDSKVVLVRSAFARVRTDADLPVAGATLRDALVGRNDLLVAVTGRDGRLLYASASAAARFPAALIGSRPPADPSARVGPIDWEHDGQSFRGSRRRPRPRCRANRPRSSWWRATSDTTTRSCATCGATWRWRSAPASR